MSLAFLSPPTPEEERALLERMARGDAAARSELIERHLLLVMHVAREFVRCNIDLEERFSLGCMGAVYAVDNFDPARGIKLGTFVGQSARGRILNALRDGKAGKRAGVVISLDAPARAGEAKTLGDLVPSPNEPPIERLAQEDERHAVRAAVTALPPDLSLYMRIRFFGPEQRSQKIAGQALGWSQMTASRREAVALGMCRAALEGAGYYGRSICNG